MKVKEKSEKSSLKLNIQKMVTASSPIISWQIDGETMEIVQGMVLHQPENLLCTHVTSQCSF